MLVVSSGSLPSFLRSDLSMKIQFAYAPILYWLARKYSKIPRFYLPELVL